MNGQLLTPLQRQRLLDNWRANQTLSQYAERARQAGRIVA
jgi:hypothetical protein